MTIDDDRFLKVKRPTTALIGGIICIMAGAIFLISYSLGLLYFENEGSYVSYFKGVFYSFFYIFLMIVSGILILLRKYKLGAGMAIVFGILVTIGTVWYLGLWSVIGGILGAISKEKLEEQVLNAMKITNRIKINDLSTKMGRSEADVELTVIKLQTGGKPIRFDAESREVIFNEKEYISPINDMSSTSLFKSESIEHSQKLRTALSIIVLAIVAVIMVGSVFAHGFWSAENVLKDVEYKNLKYGFGLNPPSGWSTDESGLNGETVLFQSPVDDGFSANLMIEMTTSGGETFVSIANQLISQGENSLKNFSLISQQPTVINGMNAYKISYSFSNASYDLKQEQIWIQKNDYVLLLIYTGTLQIYDTYLPAIETSINSVVIV